jgi:tRNA threonylcarbamoyladenosine biosynthesis protein TsaB
MKILALETSTLLGGAAIIIDGKIVAEESSMRDRSHSEVLNGFVDDCLKKSNLQLSDIDVFATGQGPGSFTGIRVAANAAKSYAYSFQKPMVTVDTLSLLAKQAGPRPQPILTIINAYKNMVYWGLFTGKTDEPEFITGPRVVPVRELSALITSEVLVIGDGYLDYENYFAEGLRANMIRDSKIPDFPSAGTLGLMAEMRANKKQTLDWNSFTPLYIRASEAEEKKQGILIQPLR